MATSPPHLLAALFVARASNEPLVLAEDDLHHMYWHAGGYVPGLGYNDAYASFTSFFTANREALRESLPSNPRLADAGGTPSLIELAIANGWAHTIRPNWGTSELEIGTLLALPETAVLGFREWNGTLSAFLRQPWAGTVEDPSGRDRLASVGVDGSTAVNLPNSPNGALSARLLELGRSTDGGLRDDDWVIFPTAERLSKDVADRLTVDLRTGALVGLHLALDGSGQHFTRAASVQRLAATIGSGPLPLMAKSPRLEGSLARPLMQLRSDMTTSDAAELLANARALETLSELLALDAQDRAGSTRTYVANMANMFTPKPLVALKATVEYVLRKRRP